jgi:hypothetical protein
MIKFALELQEQVKQLLDHLTLAVLAWIILQLVAIWWMPFLKHNIKLKLMLKSTNNFWELLILIIPMPLHLC